MAVEKHGDTVTMEVGDELTVVAAVHEDGSLTLVGTFTGPRLAKVGADAYRAEYDGVRGPVTDVWYYRTCLDQHGICPHRSFP